MNSGIVSSRYARALLLFANENGDAGQTCDLADFMVRTFVSVPDLCGVFNSRKGIVGDEIKKDILISVAGTDGMTRSMKRFIDLVFENGREENILSMLRLYVKYYMESEGMVRCKLTIPVEMPEMEKKVDSFVRRKFGRIPVTETEIEPELIGGFVLRVGDLRIDTSVSAQLDTLSEHFRKTNRKIV